MFHISYRYPNYLDDFGFGPQVTSIVWLKSNKTATICSDTGHQAPGSGRDEFAGVAELLPGAAVEPGYWDENISANILDKIHNIFFIFL